MHELGLEANKANPQPEQYKLAKPAPEERNNVARIRQRIAQGNYVIDFEAIARRLIVSIFTKP